MEDDPIRRAQSGDETAFRQLVETYTRLVWRTAQALLPDRTLAEDVLQEAWLDVWRGLPGFERQRPFRPWLLTIVARRCRKAAHRRAVLTVPLERTAVEELPGAEDVADQMARLEVDGAVQAAFSDLPSDQQRVLALRYFADLELHEIALVMDTPVGTVKSRLHRALSLLRTRLQPSYTHASSREGRYE